MPPRCQNRKIQSGSVALLRLSIFSMRNIQKIHAPSRKIFPKNHCYFSGSRIYWEVYRSSLPAPQAGELSSCTAASGGKQAGKAKLPSPPFFAVFLFCRYSYFQRCHCSVFSLSRLCYRSGTCAFGTAAGPALHFSGFFDRPDIPPFPTLSSAWIPPFPGAAIISAPASFRCRSYAGIFSFSESIAVRSLEVFSLPVFRFWISERAAFIPLGFCAVVFSVYIRRFCPVTAPFSDLGASRFLSSFCPALDTFLSSRRWCLPY